MTRVGTALGFSYAQTHNLLTPITIHSFWNSGVILFLTFLQVLIITHVCVCSVWFTGNNMQILLVFTIIFFPLLTMLLSLFVYIASRVRYQRIVAGNLMENFILCMDVEHHVQYIIQIHFVVYLCSFPCCKT